MTVDKNSNLPMHQQLYLILKEKIEKGEYKEHSQIPSESEIQSMYKISRVTVRRAISDLERDGFVKKRFCLCKKHLCLDPCRWHSHFQRLISTTEFHPMCLIKFI